MTEEKAVQATEEKTGQDKFLIVEVDDQEFRFHKPAATRGYDQFINTMVGGKATKAANNYCVMAICDDDLVKFREMKKENPGFALQVATELSDAVAPDVGATVKKR